MKLVRYGPPGREKPGILDAQGRIRDLSGVVPDLAGETLSPKGLARIRKQSIEKLPLVRGKVDPDEITLYLKAKTMRGGIVELPAGDAGPFYMLRAADHGQGALLGLSVPR